MPHSCNSHTRCVNGLYKRYYRWYNFRYNVFMRRWLKYTFRIIGLIFVVALGVWFSIRPSNNRDWTEDQKVLATAEFDGNLVHIKNIRNFTYRSTDDYTPGYYDKTFDISKLKKVSYVVEPFSNFGGSAHTFATFEFEGPEFLSISVEIRKEKGESFSAVKGLFKQYELMYVVADENDAIKLRSNYRNDDVFLYPINTTPEKVQNMFVDMLNRVNELAEKPEFYNTLTDTCTTNIVRHVNAIAPGRIPLDPRILLPGYSDKFAYDLGLIDTDLSFEEARAKFRINERAHTYADAPDFSVKIRDTNL